MKRIWVSAFILILLCTMCVLGYRTTNRISTDVISTVSSAKKAAENGDQNSAFSLSKKAVSNWRDSHWILCTYISHTRLEGIDQVLAGLPMLCYYGATDQFAAECDRSTAQLSNLMETEKLSLENVF